MKFDGYQIQARKTAIYPDKGKNFIYPTLGLVGETGEVAEKIKKVIRDKKGIFDKIPDEFISVSNPPKDFMVFDIQLRDELLSSASYLLIINCSLDHLSGSIIVPFNEFKSLIPALILLPSSSSL